MLSGDMELNAEEKQLALTLDFDEDVLRLVKSEMQRPLEPFTRLFSPIHGDEVNLSCMDVSLADLDSRGLPVILGQEYTRVWEHDYLEIIHRMRSLLLPYGYTAFLIDAFGWMPSLAILKTLDQYEIIRVVETRGRDFDHKQWQPDELIAKLQEWKHLCDFDVIGAGGQDIKLEFRTLPHDIFAFSEEVSRLCWELELIYGIEGYGGDEMNKRRAVEQLAQIMSDTHKFCLWWD